MNNNTPIVRHVLNIYNTFGEHGLHELIQSAQEIQRQVASRAATRDAKAMLNAMSQSNKKTSKTK